MSSPSLHRPVLLNFASLLKSALPGYIVIDMSAVKVWSFDRTYEALMKRERAIAVVENLPSNQELVKHLMADNVIPFRYLSLLKTRTIYQPITSEDTITTLVSVVKRAVIGMRSDCFICYEVMKGFTVPCDTCGASPCLTCLFKMMNVNDYKCANCRTTYERFEEMMEMLREKYSDRK
jgi:hypothetical protein